MKNQINRKKLPQPNASLVSCLMRATSCKVSLLLLPLYFSITLSWGQTCSVLHSFTGLDGSRPNGPLILSGDTLYSSTFWGGDTPAGGTIFRINTNGTDFRVLHTFTDSDGVAQPNGYLVLADNVLYGTTSSSTPLTPAYRSVFRINTDGTGFQVLKKFTPSTYWPWIGPMVVSGKTLIGTYGSGPIPGAGGNGGNGTLFRMDIDGSNFSVLKTFPPKGYEYVASGTRLILSDNIIYGAMQSTIYRVNIDGSGYALLHQFPSSMGSETELDLVSLEKTLYGTVNARWGFGMTGSVFSLNMDGSNFRSLRDFDPDKEGKPGGITISGTVLFGVNQDNLSSQSVFRINTDGTDYTVLFSGSSFLPSGMTFAEGTLYGVGWYSGPFGYAEAVLALPLPAPSIVAPPQTQTAEIGGKASIGVRAAGSPPLWYQWTFNGTNAVSAGKESHLTLTNLQSPQAGAYAVVITNIIGSVTSAPVLLSLIPAVDRQPVAALTLPGRSGDILDLEYSTELGPSENWQALTTVVLTNSSQSYFDFSPSVVSQRFYRALESESHDLRSGLNIAVVPALTLSGANLESLRIDYINKIGPIDAWNTLTTVTLNSPSQTYFDFTAVGKPTRLYRVIHLP